MAAARPQGGRWSTPVDLSGDDQREVRLMPRVAVDPNGNAVAVWGARPFDDEGEFVFKSFWASSRTPDGVWSDPVEISVASGIDDYDVVIDESGTATAVWSSFKEGEDDPPGIFVRAASRPLGDRWSTPVDLSAPNGADPAVAINADGNVTAVWIEPDPDTGYRVARSNSRPAGGDWSAEATDLSSELGNASDVQAAVDPQGDATAVWAYAQCRDLEACRAFRECRTSECRAALDVSKFFEVQTAHRVGEDWSRTSLLWEDPSDLGSSSVALAANPQGGATAVWDTNDSDRRRLRSSSGTAEGVWSAPVVLSSTDYWLGTTNLEVVVDPQGDATTIWAVGAGPSGGPASVETFRLEAVHRSEGTWGRAVFQSQPMLSWAGLAVDPEGYVTALWSESQPFLTSNVRSAVFDAVAPLLNDVTMPERGVVGQPVAMSVNPFDVWSAVTSRWDFGDGGSGTGAMVQHCYSTAGERTVTVTGTDGAGNATSSQGTIEIEPDPALASGVDPCAPPRPDPDPDPDPDPGSDPGPGPDLGPDSGPDPGPGSSIAPVLSGLQQSNSRWRTQGDRRGSRLPIGTTFRFTLDRFARVRLAFSQITSGRREDARCVRATRANGNKPRCSLIQPRGALEISGEAGANAYNFRGKIGGRTLKPGRYRLLVTAFADGKTSTPASIGFTIVR